MKKLSIIAVLFLLAVTFGCQQHQKTPQDTTEEVTLPETGTFGEAFVTEGSIPASEVVPLLGETDSTEAILTGHIVSSCQHTGCWMDLDMGGQESIHVTFKDDDFTIPLDAAGKNAIVKGIAYREMIPVETLQNYAREDGLSEEEVAAINEPAWEYNFIATGVVIED